MEARSEFTKGFLQPARSKSFLVPFTSNNECEKMNDEVEKVTGKTFYLIFFLKSGLFF